MPKYFLTNKAIEDLSTIWDYSYEVWSENQADKYYVELLNDCNELANNPNLGRNYEDIRNDVYGYKAGQHIIFYRKINESEIEITRFLHSRMDLKIKIKE